MNILRVSRDKDKEKPEILTRDDVKVLITKKTNRYQQVIDSKFAHMQDEIKKHEGMMEKWQAQQKDSMNAWKKEQEMYNQVMHGELMELTESKYLVTKLSEQLRSLAHIITKEQTSQDTINKEIKQLYKAINEVQKTSNEPSIS
jgi:hypothetical protein